MTTQQETQGARRQLQGSVVSTRMAKTAVVRVDRQVPHEKYHKYFTISKKFHVHDETGVAKVGDTVLFQEVRPLSKTKCWSMVRVISSPVTA